MIDTTHPVSTCHSIQLAYQAKAIHLLAVHTYWNATLEIDL